METTCIYQLCGSLLRWSAWHCINLQLELGYRVPAYLHHRSGHQYRCLAAGKFLDGFYFLCARQFAMHQAVLDAWTQGLHCLHLGNVISDKETPFQALSFASIDTEEA